MKRIIPVRIIGLSLAMFMTVCSFSNISLFAQGNGRYHDIELEVGGLARTYALYVPEGHDGTEEWPLVFLFHGLRVPVQDQIEISQMYLVADTARFMIVYPQGLEVGHPVWGDGVGWHVPDYYTAIPERNDVEFIERIISDLNAKPEFANDPDRIHATGYSNGAQMSFYLACVFSNRIASVAGVAGQMSDYLINQVCEPLRPISVLHIQGTADKGFPSEGNEISLPLEGTAEFWAELNGCNLSPESTYLEDINPDDASTVKLLNYNYCDDGVYEVLLYSIEGGGHTWPGGWLPEYLEWHLPVNRDMNASSEIWNFFKRNPRPSNIMMVEIPDTTFLFALIDEGIDTNKDSLISYTEAEAVISLHVDEKGISDLTGIEAFVNLDTLNCSKNQLSSLDVSKNHYLRKLICTGNNDIDTRGRLTSLNLSSNLLLTDLNCSYNRIADLDLSKNTDLIWLECRQNDLKSLDLTNNTALRGLWCSSNMLSSLFINNTQLKELRCGDNTLPNLDVKNNTQLEILEIGNMSSLDEVCVWETFSRDLIEIDTAGSPNVYFTTECLKKTVYMPDEAFLDALIKQGVDTNGDNLISYAEAEVVRSLLNLNQVDEWDYSCWYSAMPKIKDLTGIEAFTNLEYLDCSCGEMTALDLSNNIFLNELRCNGNSLTSLDVSNLNDLVVLECANNQISSLDISNLNDLVVLECANNQLTSLDVSNNSLLTSLGCMENQITSLDVSNNSLLTVLWCGGNPLTRLDVSYNTELKELDCSWTKLITRLDISNNPALSFLECSWNRLTSLDLSGNPRLQGLLSGYNKLTHLDLCNNDSINFLEVVNMYTLDTVYVWDSFPTGVEYGTSGSPNVVFINCSSVGIEENSQSGFSIFPNPTNSSLTIETDYPNQYSIEITSLNGQQIYIGEMEGSSHHIDLTSFQKGVYFITIRSKDTIITRKIIKL